LPGTVAVWAAHATLTSESWSLFGTGPVFDPILWTDPIHDRPRSGGIFGQFDGETLPLYIFRLRSGSFWIRSAYYLLISFSAHVEPRPSHFRHVCLLPASTTGMSMPLMVPGQPGTYFWRKERRKAGETLLSVASCTCTGLSMISCLHRSAGSASGASGVECIHMCVRKRGGKRRNAQRSGKARKTMSTMPFTSSRDCIFRKITK
jgi:hypothetical protein